MRQTSDVTGTRDAVRQLTPGQIIEVTVQVNLLSGVPHSRVHTAPFASALDTAYARLFDSTTYG